MKPRAIHHSRSRQPLVDAGALAARVADLEKEREVLLELLSQQQRVAQAGLVTAGLAHDVDNHAQIISGAALLAASRPDPEAWKRALDRIQKQCFALTDTTQAFLGFVRRRDMIGAQQFSLLKVVDEVQRLTHPLARHHGVDLVLHVEGQANFDGNPRLLTQAIVNLVTNAIRACPARGGTVVITASATKDGGRIVVTDNGSGIPAGVRRTLFRPFSSERRQGNGNGLGLFIVRQNVRRLGGSIRVRSSSEGTSFRIDL